MNNGKQVKRCLLLRIYDCKLNVIILNRMLTILQANKGKIKQTMQLSRDI